jgi:hypothetical protein
MGLCTFYHLSNEVSYGVLNEYAYLVCGLEHIFFHILRVSSSQLTNITYNMSYRGGLYHPSSCFGHSKKFGCDPKLGIPILDLQVACNHNTE